jgi:hypothetical protein
MSDYEKYHQCKLMESDIQIIATRRSSYDPQSKAKPWKWMIEWGYRDPNDPSYGNLDVNYCPFCGQELR